MAPVDRRPVDSDHLEDLNQRTLAPTAPTLAPTLARAALTSNDGATKTRMVSLAEATGPGLQTRRIRVVIAEDSAARLVAPEAPLAQDMAALTSILLCRSTIRACRYEVVYWQCLNCERATFNTFARSHRTHSIGNRLSP